MEGSGRWYLNEAKALIKHDHNLYIKKEPSFHSRTSNRALLGKFIQQNISALKEIKNSLLKITFRLLLLFHQTTI